MKKSKVLLSFLIALFAITFTSCKKEAINPSAISKIDGNVMKVESIKVGEIEISQYLISNFTYNASLPTLFEPKISNSGTSLLYKTMEPWQMETATLIETRTGLLNIQFKDPNPNGIGYENNTYVPQELKDKKIITYQQNNGSYPYQAYMICSAEIMNGNYSVEEKDSRFILTQHEAPGIVITLTKK